MKRRLLIIAICVLLGAVVNVAVAWGCALLSVKGAEQQGHKMVRCPWLTDIWCAPRSLRRAGAYRILVEVFYGTPDEPDPFTDFDTRLGAILPAWAFQAAVRQLALLKDDGEPIILDARGWPFQSLMSETLPYQRSIRYGWVLPQAHERYGSTASPTNWPGHEHLKSWVGFYFAELAIPLRPIWPGFALNTIFYATIVWVLIPGPFTLRRFLRLRRGRCPKCAYPMGESVTCTECGKPLPSRVRVP